MSVVFKPVPEITPLPLLTDAVLADAEAILSLGGKDCWTFVDLAPWPARAIIHGAEVDLYPYDWNTVEVSERIYTADEIDWSDDA